MSDRILHAQDLIFQYGKHKIPYTLYFCKRKTLEIAVHPDLLVTVKAPLDAETIAIEKKLSRRGRWIVRQLNYFRQFSPRTPVRSYVNGETHLYLGKKYRIKLVAGMEQSVKLYPGFLKIFGNNLENQQIEQSLNLWYKEKALIKFQESMDRCWLRFANHNIPRPTFLLKRMKKRWGSLTGNGVVLLNPELIKAPGECIDYVVIHEMCHLIYHDHSPEFYNLLDRILPEWEKVKHKLELALA